MDDDWFTAADNSHLASLSDMTAEAQDALSLAFAATAHVLVPLAKTNIPADGIGANALAGSACFGLAHRHLRAALMLLHYGYYESVPPLLRAAFESAECGQYLSKDPDAADRWVRRPTSWPRKEVRQRLGDLTQQPEYVRGYALMSDRTHPTVKAAVGSVFLDGEHLRVRILRDTPESEPVFFLAVWLAATAVFTCFAMRNASPEGALEPRWLEGVAYFANALNDRVGGVFDLDHLVEDWDREQARWQSIVNALVPNEDLDRLLDEHPQSWRRASRAAGADADPSDTE